VSQNLKERIERANEAYCYPSILLPTGDVVQIFWGQVSGSVLTTSNNCIGHTILENYKLISACPEATDNEILSQGGNLYGDDILNSYTNQFKKLKEFEFVASIYAQFGMTVKPGTFKVSDNPEGLSFLGGTCKSFLYNEKIYFIPSYEKERINAGLQFSLDPLTPDDELNKAFALLELGWEHSYGPIFEYITYLFRKAPDTPVKRSYVNKGIPTKEAVMLQWAGIRSIH